MDMNFLTNLSQINWIVWTISFIIWLLCEWWIIRRIVQSKLVKSKKERAFWIIFCIVSFFLGMIVFFNVTNQRRKEKYYYHRSDNNSDKTES